MSSMATEFRLREIPTDLWRTFRAACALEGKGANDKLIELIREAVEKTAWPEREK